MPSLASLAWLENLALPHLSEAKIRSLNAPYTVGEITNIIVSLKTSKALGPDVFFRSYTLGNLLANLPPRFAKMFTHIINGHHIPDDMLLAKMSLLPKPNKDHTLPQNFRPISVINNDLKLFDRLLADRLAKIITSLISPDQMGFIPSSQITDNIRQACNVIQDPSLYSCQVMMISIDIHKTFDSVVWPYLESILTKFGFRGEFVHSFWAL